MSHRVRPRRRAVATAILAGVGLGSVAVGATGCGPRSIFEWGSYEVSVYSLYAGETDVQGQIRLISEEIERTVARDRLVPPGKYAHLGYLYYLSGNSAAAAAAFRAEKLAFPESEVLMDHFLTRLESDDTGVSEDAS